VQYAAFESSTTVSIKSSTTQATPSFTFCSINAYKASKLPGTRFFPASVQAKYDQTGFTDYLSEEDWDLVFDELEQVPPSIDEIESLGLCHTYEDLVITAELGDLDIPATDFTSFYHPDYCLCHTYTPATYPIIKRPGASPRSDNIYMIFSAEPEEYLPYETGVGVRVQVHAPGYKSSPQENGVSISAGSLTWVGATKNVLERLPAPHGSCKPGEYGKLSGLTIEECRYAALVKLTAENCSCINFLLDTYIIEEFATEAARLPVCATSEQWACAFSMDSQLDIDAMCSLNCSETYYDMSSTSTRWPTRAYAASFAASINAAADDDDISPQQATDILRDGYAAMTLYYESLNLRVTTDTKAMEFPSFIAQLGGTFRDEFYMRIVLLKGTLTTLCR
jgi:hypothetical protein